MTVERTKDEVIIRLFSNIETEDLQDMINYVHYKELISDFEAKQADVDALAKELYRNAQGFTFFVYQKMSIECRN